MSVFLGWLLVLARNMPLSVLSVIITPAELLGFVIGPILIINMIRYAKKEQAIKEQANKESGPYNRFGNFPFKSSVCFIASILIAIIFHEGIEFVAREEVKAFLRGVSPDVRVYAEGQPSKNSNEIINALNKITSFPYHGSHPTIRIPIEIVSGDKILKLVLRRDSKYPQEYYVYYPKYSRTSSSNIGGITTNLFDDY
jgi:hypothetical protein